MKDQERTALEQFKKSHRGLAESQSTLAIGEHALQLIRDTGDLSVEALMESLQREAVSENEMTRVRAEKAISDLRGSVESNLGTSK